MGRATRGARAGRGFSTSSACGRGAAGLSASGPGARARLGPPSPQVGVSRGKGTSGASAGAGLPALSATARRSNASSLASTPGAGGNESWNFSCNSGWRAPPFAGAGRAQPGQSAAPSGRALPQWMQFATGPRLPAMPGRVKKRASPEKSIARAAPPSCPVWFTVRPPRRPIPRLRRTCLGLCQRGLRIRRGSKQAEAQEAANPCGMWGVPPMHAWPPRRPANAAARATRSARPARRGS